MDTGKKTTAWKAFRDLWVAGTVGGFLAALMRSVPLDLSKRVEAPSGLFTFDLVLRYAYLLWFIAYFLLSNLRKDELRKWDVAFDVIQSTASFFAAFALGIAVRGEGYQSSEAFQSANGAILAICFFSLLFFGRRDYREGHHPSNLLRIGGGVTAIVGWLVSRNNPLGLTHLVALAATLLLLSVLLILFGQMRINELPQSLEARMPTYIALLRYTRQGLGDRQGLAKA